jgi:hypothetical protein
MLYMILGATMYYLYSTYGGSLSMNRPSGVCSPDLLESIICSYWTYVNLFYHLKPCTDQKSFHNNNKKTEFDLFYQGLTKFFDNILEEKESAALRRLTVPSNLSEFTHLFESAAHDENYIRVLEFLDILQCRLSYYNLHKNEFEVSKFINDVADRLVADWEWDEEKMKLYWLPQEMKYDEHLQEEFQEWKCRDKERLTPYVSESPYKKASPGARNVYDTSTCSATRCVSVKHISQSAYLRGPEIPLLPESQSAHLCGPASPSLPDFPYETPLPETNDETHECPRRAKIRSNDNSLTTRDLGILNHPLPEKTFVVLKSE